MANIKTITVNGTSYAIRDEGTANIVEQIVNGTYSVSGGGTAGLLTSTLKAQIEALLDKKIATLKGTASSRSDLNSISATEGDIYIIKDSSDSNLNQEWIRTSDGWELLGVISAEVDLSGVVTLAGTQTITGSKTFSGAVKVGQLVDSTSNKTATVDDIYNAKAFCQGVTVSGEALVIPGFGA